MQRFHPTRRGLIGTALALPFLSGCASPFEPLTGSAATPEATALLAASADAHGLQALSRMHDVNVSYEGHFRPLVGKIVPALVDAGYRGRSEERLLLGERVTAQAHAGPQGKKQVFRRSGATAGDTGETRVWLDGQRSDDAVRLAAAALVADCYALFLIGPMIVAGHWASERKLVLAVDRPERIGVGDRSHECDVLRVDMMPGFGLAASDQMALYIDRSERLMRRVRFTPNGLDVTRGAIAEVDAWDHVAARGVRWPTRFHERLLRPAPLPVHDWRLTGLDVDRGLTAGEVDGATFGGRAERAATALG